MENNNEYDPVAHKHPGPEEKAAVEDYEKREYRNKTPAQDVLITKIMKSKKILDKEYRMFRTILDNQVISSYDAAVFIEHILSLLKFRRTFFNGKHKAYKQCFFCDSRDNVQRYLDVAGNKKAWVCETCAINLDPGKVVLTKINESKEASADLYRKYDYSAEQEDIDEDARHGVLE